MAAQSLDFSFPQVYPTTLESFRQCFDRTPYTYYIGWTGLNVWYYGVRHAKGCNPNDLWVRYFTSSKYVSEYREKYGEPDVIHIHKTFSTVWEARLYEETVLYNFYNSGRWGSLLNQNIRGSNCLTEHSEETKERIGEANSGENSPNYGKPIPESIKQKIRDSKVGSNHSEGSIQRMRDAKRKDAKLTKEDVISIRENKHMPYNELVEQFGISKTTISRIIKYKAWADV